MPATTGCEIMTKEEALQILDTIPTIGEQVDALELAIKALEQQPCEDCISRQAAIDEIEYEFEMINSALDSMTLDFNARERLRQRRGEAIEILNSIQQLPTATPSPIIGRWIEVIDDTDSSGCKKNWHYKCSICGNEDSCWGEYNYCPICGAEMKKV